MINNPDNDPLGFIEAYYGPKPTTVMNHEFLIRVAAIANPELNAVKQIWHKSFSLTFPEHWDA